MRRRLRGSRAGAGDRVPRRRPYASLPDRANVRKRGQTPGIHRLPGIAGSAMMRGMPPTGRPAERRLAAVERALRVLDAFLRVRGDAGTTELSRLTGINASTVSRMLSTLVDAGYVEHVPDTGRYRLGTHLLALSNHVLAGLDLRVLARPHLEALEIEVGETATLSLPSDPDAITVDFVPSRATVASVARIGRASVAHATATGKVMLAFAGGPRRTGRVERFT